MRERGLSDIGDRRKVVRISATYPGIESRSSLRHAPFRKIPGMGHTGGRTRRVARSPTHNATINIPSPDSRTQHISCPQIIPLTMAAPVVAAAVAVVPQAPPDLRVAPKALHEAKTGRAASSSQPRSKASLPSSSPSSDSVAKKSPRPPANLNALPGPSIPGAVKVHLPANPGSPNALK